MPTALGTQQPYNGYRWFGPAVHLSIFSGSASTPLGGSGCDPKCQSSPKDRLGNVVLKEIDGPMLKHGLQGFDGKRISLQGRPDQRPNAEFLAERYELFRKAG